MKLWGKVMEGNLQREPQKPNNRGYGPLFVRSHHSLRNNGHAIPGKGFENYTEGIIDSLVTYEGVLKAILP